MRADGWRGRATRRVTLCLTLCLLAACTGRQSALDPAGEDAATLAQIFLTMFIAALVIWLLLNGIFFAVTRLFRREMSRNLANGLVIGGGIVLPVLLIGALLTWGLSILPDHDTPGDGLTIRVTGEQWWWRVAYETAEGDVITANEIRLPVGERVDFRLDSHRVIHSFWIPALGGKMDMFPGRETHMSLRATEAGLYRGQCAEFCGASHAWMAFEVEAMAPEAFAAWLAAEAAPAAPPAGEAARRGEELFAREGCGGCHTIRGTQHQGLVGPDLTHVGSRHSLGAGRLGAGRLGASLEDFSSWIAHTDDLKPEVEMPPYDHLSPDELTDLATYLKGLE
ncbi:cytochrome c oxidase subunit II [Pseudoroseicyclus sp. H15]